jgi:outer membrane protein assembly factor BamD
MMKRVLWVVGVVALSGCLFKGKPKPPPPAETVEATAARADSLWREALRQFRAAKWNKAAVSLDRAMLIFDYADPRRPMAHFMMGEVLLAQDNQLQAVREFRKVADENASDALAPDALLRAGDAYAALWRRPELDPTYGETAMTTYREVLERYAGTTAAAQASQRILTLGELFAEKEYNTAMFYYRIKATDSAILSFRNIVATYPRTRIVPRTLEQLVRAYHRLDYVEDLKETCQYIARFFPDTAKRVVLECPAEAPGEP